MDRHFTLKQLKISELSKVSQDIKKVLKDKKFSNSSSLLSMVDINVALNYVFDCEKDDYIFDMEDDEIAEFQVFAKKVATALKAAFPCIKVGQAVLGLEVPHAHIHLIPMQSEKDMLFTNPKMKFTDEEFKDIANKVYTEFCKQ